MQHAYETGSYKYQDVMTSKILVSREKTLEIERFFVVVCCAAAQSILFMMQHAFTASQICMQRLVHNSKPRNLMQKEVEIPHRGSMSTSTRIN